MAPVDAHTSSESIKRAAPHQCPLAMEEATELSERMHPTDTHVPATMHFETEQVPAGTPASSGDPQPDPSPQGPAESLLETTESVERGMQKRIKSISEQIKPIQKIFGRCLDVIRTIRFVLLFLTVCGPIPVTMIWIGFTYLGECPVEPGLPAFLIAGGVNGLLLVLCISIKGGLSEDDKCIGRDIVLAIGEIFICVCAIFSVAWYVAGDTVVFRSRERHNDDPTSENYCHPTLYLFAFWLLVIIQSIPYLVLFCSACMVVWAGFTECCCYD